jgi:hypothetical protein
MHVAMAQVMSGMPDVWRRVLAEHVPDQGGRCQACRDEGGFSASWPCLTRQIAEQAKRIHDDPPTEFPPLRAANWRPETPATSTSEWQEEPAPARSAEWQAEPASPRSAEWQAEPRPLRSTGRHAAP